MCTRINSDTISRVPSPIYRPSDGELGVELLKIFLLFVFVKA